MTPGTTTPDSDGNTWGDDIGSDREVFDNHCVPTVASQLTAVGRSAVAVIGLRGPLARRCLDACFEPAQLRDYQPGQVRYGVWWTNERTGPGSAKFEGTKSEGGAIGESIVITPLDDDEFEIHAHGGVAAISKIMRSLVHLGVRRIDADAYESRGHDQRLTREAESVLMCCSTTRNAAIAMNQVRFGLAAWVKPWFASSSNLGDLQAATRDIMRYASVGSHLVDSYRVVLAGPPNVGKSSLINRLVGFGRAITHDAPGTTRDVIACDTVIAGLNIRLSDTAGIRADGGTIEREGIRRGAIAIAQADLVVAVVSPSCLNELPTMRQRMQALSPKTRIVEVLNQADRLQPTHLADANLPRLRTIAVAPLDVSARDDGMADLTDAIINQLRPADPDARQAIPINQRQRDHLHEILRCDDIDSAMVCLRRLAGEEL